MINKNGLRAAVVRNGLRMQDVAVRIGVSSPCLSEKVNSKREFKASEINRIAQLLNLSPNEICSIFFENWDEKTST